MTTAELLEKVASGKVKPEEAAALLAEEQSKNVRIKVSEKGCVTFRGVPGTNVQYGFSPRRETLEWLYANQKRVQAFVKEHDSEITERSEASKAAKAAKATA